MLDSSGGRNQSNRVEYRSTTHGGWISAQIVSTDLHSGAIQIDKKPGVWLSAEDQRNRIRFRAVELAAQIKELPAARVARARTDSGLDAARPGVTSVRHPLGERLVHSDSAAESTHSELARREEDLLSETLGTASPSRRVASSSIPVANTISSEIESPLAARVVPRSDFQRGHSPSSGSQSWPVTESASIAGASVILPGPALPEARIRRASMSAAASIADGNSAHVAFAASAAVAVTGGAAGGGAVSSSSSNSNGNPNATYIFNSLRQERSTSSPMNRNFGTPVVVTPSSATGVPQPGSLPFGQRLAPSTVSATTGGALSGFSEKEPGSTEAASLPFGRRLEPGSSPFRQRVVSSVAATSAGGPGLVTGSEDRVQARRASTPPTRLQWGAGFGDGVMAQEVGASPTFRSQRLPVAGAGHAMAPASSQTGAGGSSVGGFSVLPPSNTSVLPTGFLSGQQADAASGTTLIASSLVTSSNNSDYSVQPNGVAVVGADGGCGGEHSAARNATFLQAGGGSGDGDSSPGPGPAKVISGGPMLQRSSGPGEACAGDAITFPAPVPVGTRDPKVCGAAHLKHSRTPSPNGATGPSPDAAPPTTSEGIQSRGESAIGSASPRPATELGRKVQTIVKYRCPACGELVDSVQEAMAHCTREDFPAVSGKRTEGSLEPSTCAPLPAPMVSGALGPTPGGIDGEPIAFDGRGRATIVRQVDPISGQAKTVVLNEDGSTKEFDLQTVHELAGKNKNEASKCLDDLTNHQLRGLVHEVGQRLLVSSQLYHKRLSELERLGDVLNFMYFGLDGGASERDLDNAYRKMAKKMHPDKNGGTEEAKKRFQHMKERYEKLKKRLNPAAEEDEKKEKDEKCGDDEGKGDEKGVAKNNGDGQEEAEEKGQSTSIEYDPSDRSSMEKTATKMLSQLQNVDIQMEVLVKELHRARSQVPMGARGAS